MAYTNALTKRALGRYLDAKSLLYGQSSRLHNLYIGQTRARSPIDGKRQARAREELLCTILDIEQAIQYLHYDDRDVLVRHFFMKDTLDEIKLDYNIQTRGGMQLRISRAVQRLVFELNHLYARKLP